MTQCPSCGGDCGGGNGKSCKYKGIGTHMGVQGLVLLARNAMVRIEELEKEGQRLRDIVGGNMIRTWQERCEDFDDSHITTHQDVKNMMLDEIEELRTALCEMEQRWKLAERLRGRPRIPGNLDECGSPHLRED